MKKRYIAVIAMLSVGGMLTAQNEKDAFRYAQYSPTGTARYSSMAGSMGAFGADFTSLSANNPAGIGLYKRSEITLTLAPFYNKVTSTYNGEQRIGSRYGFGLNNVGAVFPFSTAESSKWRKVQFGIGLNNLARYKSSFTVTGPNTGGIEGTTNFFDHVAEYSIGTKPDFLEGIAGTAYDYFLMDSLSDGTYFCNVGDYFDQQQIKITEGYLNEYVISLGANYDDQLFLGATIGIPFFSYTQKTDYIESENDFYVQFKSYDEFKSNAVGVNFKLGLIYQPAKFIRIGAAFHTPTVYPNVKESYLNYYELLGVYQPLDSLYYDVSETSSGRFDYQLTTPYRAMANLAFIFNKYGFINVDYEFTDYSTSNLQSNTYTFVDENDAIRGYYRGVHTIRAGGEFNLSPLALRLGYSYSTNPYKGIADIDGTCQTIAAGIGLKGKTFFADFAYMYRFTKDKDVFYDATSIYPYSSRIVNQVFALTLGLKF